MSGVPVYLHALGMINALGADLDAIVPALAASAAPGMGAVPMRNGDSFVGRVMAPLDIAPPAALAHYDCRNNRLLLAALAQIAPALENARARYGARRIGVVLGTSTSGIDAAEAALAQRVRTGELPAAFDYRQMEIGTVAPFAAAALNLRGPAFTISTACTSSAKVFVAARRLLQLKLCDAVVVGGVDALCELTVQGFGSLESTSVSRSNPMSRNRCGINIGEGAAVFLMSRDEALVRLAGAGESSDAHHISAPDPQGVGGERALRAALADAGIAAAAVGYVNLHATATRKNDEMEAHLLARVFPAGVAASGTKPLTGHPLGAAGATELGFAWLALARPDVALPRHLWDGEADPALPVLDLVEDERRLASAGGAYAMSNSFAFGGSNVSLILGR
ncbi:MULTISPECIES: beta-ketoacyl-[acyl-carrier-protein] synthase family protein [Paraburkholderia]|uniref:3-oxoacyl-[acyl-carrier-protein] synthase-1 n=2 Tax=Paraburkholderia megapolitana TaxID=420953 RepID=A0A1I3J5A8_9BURK|nr:MULTISPECIES: beta-ketoacyl-[acyl-carrier-protein] synthase family protein [Paraburkholderia]MCX4160842.1 beta-ketoacyl-[acyl-carrier-protein] synthase family protein [Paraburkholderia megapolitana]MDN7156339.1 beta-ketoacyl-[acyl-carrier-protein] synthase family protein [Paraburkholderia sp. CHISQ3]MDQ6493384.1 beta-ketoacyl-[acyl-carrier-protein] synthase family protein [Paraburkholderia megapolitana]QDQ84928.1 beta-ketoacyl-[acyl-carrier-protein] synthase family protein [Paraburkholderia 